MNVETERLILLPLDSNHLSLSIENFQELEKKLGLTITYTKLSEEMQYAMKVRRKKVLLDESNYLWLTNWAIILKEINCIIGFIMIKGYPNEIGEVIVGYEIENEYQCKGYATEAVSGLIKWIFKDERAKCVIADTEKFNIPSHRVLEKIGAAKYKEEDELLWWRINKK